LVETSVDGIGDNRGSRGYIAFADSIQIGDLQFQHCPVEVIEKSPINESDGLIGGDVFEDFLVDIDFPNQKLRLSQLPPIPGADTQAAGLDSQGNEPRYYNRYIAPEMKSYTPVSRFGHMLLIPTRVNQLPPKLFLLDTGAFGNTISPAAAREVTGVSSDSDIDVKGLSGKVKTVFRANELTLTFGHLSQKNQDMVAFDISALSDSAGTEISGILGFSMLAMLDVKIDYRDGLVDFIYDKNRVRLYH
jgi:Aspartyl protease